MHGLRQLYIFFREMCKKDVCEMDNGHVINIGRKYKDAFSIKMIEYNKCVGG